MTPKMSDYLLIVERNTINMYYPPPPPPKKQTKTNPTKEHKTTKYNNHYHLQIL